ncbi:MAG: AAA family ATPase [Candidatus Kapaibacterium sp.]
MNSPYIIVVAGPNGVGKSTFASRYLQDFPDCAGIVDPDAIARELLHLPEVRRNIAAGRVALEQISDHLENYRSFAIETTLSGKTLASTLERAARLGYYIAIALLWVPSVRVTRQRIEMRRRSGRHSIDVEDQIRRFDRCYINFFTTYRQLCHDWTLFIGIGEGPESLATGQGGLATA